MRRYVNEDYEPEVLDKQDRHIQNAKSVTTKNSVFDDVEWPDDEEDLHAAVDDQRY